MLTVTLSGAGSVYPIVTAESYDNSNPSHRYGRGIIATRTNAIQTDLTNLTTQQSNLADYQSQLTSMYTAQFTALNTLMATMNSNQQYLTQLFGGTNSAGALATNKS